MRYFFALILLFTALTNSSSAASIQVAEGLFSSVSTAQDLFNFGIGKEMSRRGFFMHERKMGRLLEKGHVFEIAHVFNRSMDHFIAFMPEIREKIGDDHLFTALLFSLLKDNPNGPYTKTLAREFTSLYADYPKSVKLVEIVSDLPLSLVAYIGRRSFVSRNFGVVKYLMDCGLLDLNAISHNSNNLKGNFALYVTDIESAIFALQHGLDFNKRITLPDGSKITSLLYLYQHRNNKRQMMDLLLTHFPFSEKVLKQASEELASLGVRTIHPKLSHA